MIIDVQYRAACAIGICVCGVREDYRGYVVWCVGSDASWGKLQIVWARTNICFRSPDVTDISGNKSGNGGEALPEKCGACIEAVGVFHLLVVGIDEALVYAMAKALM